MPLMVSVKDTREILHYGNHLNQVSHFGIVIGVKVDLDGILSVLLWLMRFSKSSQLIFILEEKILNSLITIMR
jgi:hypothetical protein